MNRVLLLALALGTFLCGPALAILPEPTAAVAPNHDATECTALASAYERGHWDGWRKHAQMMGGGL